MGGNGCIGIAGELFWLMLWKLDVDAIAGEFML